MGVVKVQLILLKKKKNAAKQIQHSKISKSNEPKQPKAQTKKAGKSKKQSFTVDGTWAGDEREGLSPPPGHF